MPSLVAFTDTGYRVGAAAKAYLMSDPECVIQSIKRHMGNSHWRYFDRTGEYTPTHISALILQALKFEAESHLGVEIQDAVITVPAYFDDTRRKATRVAGELAGFTVKRLVNEPTAASLAFSVTAHMGGNHLVYDLGGGTFDVSILKVDGHTFTVLATNGDRNLGGKDWDDVIMRWLNEQASSGHYPDRLDGGRYEQELRLASERAKRTLSMHHDAEITLTMENVTQSLRLSRSKFDELTCSLLDRTLDLCEQALEDTDLGWSDIDVVVPVGGSTNMPQVRRRLEEAWGKTVDRSIFADEAVALGAAMQAHSIALQEEEDTSGRHTTTSALKSPAPLTINDVTSQSLGVLCYDKATKRVYNSILVPRNSPIPARERETYYTIDDYQIEVCVEVTEGEDTDPRYVNIIGTKDIIIPSYPAGAPIDIDCAYDLDQIVYIEVIDGTTIESLGKFSIDRKIDLV